MQLSKNDIEDLKILGMKSSQDGYVMVPKNLFDELVESYNARYGAPAQPVTLINKLVQQIRALGATPNV
jgi:hypothetical protein